MRPIRFVFVFALQIILVFSKREEKIHKFTKVECKSFDEESVVIESCSVSPNNSLEMAFNILKPFDSIHVSFENKDFKRF